jgi:hypothetical protein
VGALPRFASGLADVDVCASGFYGLAVAGGPPKSGKSLLALRVGLDTAARGDALVVYVDFELDRFTFSSRLFGATGVKSSDELPTWVADRFHVLDGADSSAEELADQIAMQLDEEASRVLVVVDSINRMAKNQQRHERGGNLFLHLGDVVSWARNIVTLTSGEISCLLVSETNRAGAIVGLDPEYAADCFVTLAHTGNPGEVEIEFTSRSTPGFSKKPYMRDGYGVRFTPVGSMWKSPAERAAGDDSFFDDPQGANVFDIGRKKR